MTDTPMSAPPGGVLILTRADLFPANFGSAVKIDRTAAALSRLACPVRIVTEDRAYYHSYWNGQRTAHRFPPWLGLGPWSRLIRHRLRWKGVPVDEAFLYVPLIDWSITLRAAWVAARSGARVFQAESPGYALPCLRLRRWLGGCVVLAEHNVEVDRIAAQQPHLPPRVRRWLHRVEVGLCNRSDRVVAVSELDRQALISAGVRPELVEVIPLGVDIASFNEATRPPRLDVELGSGAQLLVYHGTFRYAPNLRAIRIMAEEILPRLNTRGLFPKVLAVGAYPPPVAIHPDVIFTGAVESVAPFIKAAAVAVVPLEQGGGTRMKVLDYFAASVPVVSTSKGVEGLGLKDGEHALIRDGYDSIADAVGSLLTDPDLARRLAEAGRQHVEQFDWAGVARAHLDLYAEGACTSEAREVRLLR